MLFDDAMMEKVETYWEMAMQDDHRIMRQGIESLKKEIPDLITFSEFHFYLSSAAEIELPLGDEIGYFEDKHGLLEIPFGLALAIVARGPFDELSEYSKHPNPGIRLLVAAIARNDETFDLLVGDACVLVRCMVAAVTGDKTEWYLQKLMDDPNLGVREYLEDTFQIEQRYSESSSAEYLSSFENCPCNTKESQ